MLGERSASASDSGADAGGQSHRIHATGEMAQRTRAFRWDRTALGPIDVWPQALIFSLTSMLESRFPASILWGPELLQFYNDAYLPLTAEKHPALLGQSAREQWAEAWHIIGPQLESVLHSGESISQKNVLVPVRRDGTIKDVYWTYSYSPIRHPDGSIGGILIVCHDVTGEVHATRERDSLATNLQTVLDSITDGLLVLNQDWCYTYLNDQGARTLGMRQEDLIGACVWDLFPQAKGSRFYEGYHRAVESGQPVHFEEYYPGPWDKWLECHCYPGERGLSVYFRDITERKQNEQTLRQSEERFRTLFELAPVGVAITDATTGEILFANEQLTRITGYSIAELTKLTGHDLTHPDDREQNRNLYRRIVEDNGPEIVNKRYVRKDGTPVSVRVSVRLVHDPGCHAPQVLGTIEDVTEILNAQAARANSEARLTELVDSIPALAWIADSNGAIFWYNRRWYEYTGTVAEQMEGWGWKSVHDPEILPVVLERWNYSIQTGAPFEMVFPLRGADGVLRSFLTRVLPLKNAAGEVTRWFGTNTEIDELERTRHELTVAQERIRIALKNVPLVLYTTDRELRYTWMNRAYDGFDAAEMIGRSDDEIDPAGALSELARFKQSVLERGADDRREITLTARGLSEIYDTSAEPVRGPDNAITGLTVAAHNITRQRLAEEALRKAEKLAVAGRLAAAISHEINNPLEAVINLLYLLRTSTQEAQTSEYVRLAEEELARVSQIVTQSLRFHRQSTIPTFEKMSSLIDSALAIYRTRIEPDFIHVRRDYKDTALVHCYSSELRQVFGNFIGNAFDALRQGGTLHLRTRNAQDTRSGRKGVRITVADSGHGMDPGTLNRISEPFFTTKGENGTGLGLWISRDILTKHQATLQVKSSQHHGRSGTVFCMFVPLDAIQHSSATIKDSGELRSLQT